MKQKLNRLEFEYEQKVQEQQKNKKFVSGIQQQAYGYNTANTLIKRHTYTPIEFNKNALSVLELSVQSGEEEAQLLYDTADGMLVYIDNVLTRLLFDKERESASIRQQYSLLNNTAQEGFNASDEIRRFQANGSAYSRVIQDLESDERSFCGSARTIGFHRNGPTGISIGRGNIEIPAVPELAELNRAGIDFRKGVASVPVQIDWSSVSVLLAGYISENEMVVLSGIANLIINSAIYREQRYAEIAYFDTVRFNGEGIRPLTKLCGDERWNLSGVPTGKSEISKRLETLLSSCRSATDHGQAAAPRMLIFHNFPNGYESKSVDLIKQLCANAKLYNLNIIITCLQGQDNSAAQIFAELHNTHMAAVTAQGLAFYGSEKISGTKWYQAPDKLADSMLRAFLAPEKPKSTNIYDLLEGIPSRPVYKKGSKRIPDIPYGKNEEGKVQTLQVEDSNFATFICGASRSGKSTLLHTLITGVLKNMHPDDVEMWLVDFKMTEFSRYAKHRPPHVRYIVLDESAELVYDLVDRLYEILMKRQNIFKNARWEKLSDVPPERYMPAILVIIDEFSVMSEILAQSVLTEDDNYQYKMQLLLVKGAAVGMHFIFASQGFSTGTRGLTDMAKNQINQRVAMKTPISEIRQTLDIRDPSDRDIHLMEELAPHHALVRVPMTSDGNRLLHSEVLYIDNVGKQYQMIDSMAALKPVAVFEPDNAASYISKKTLVLDGTVYQTFEENTRSFRAWLRQNAEQLEDTDEAALFIGQPLRLLPYVPVRLSKAFRENILLIAPSYENEAAASVLSSIIKSMQLNVTGSETRILSSERSRMLKRLQNVPGQETYIGLNTVCGQIRELKTRIERKREDNCTVILLGFESLLMDMAYIEEAEQTVSDDPLSIFQIPGENGLDLNTQVSMLSAGLVPDTTSAAASGVYESEDSEEKPDHAYDARDDLRYILVNGPRLGYHFVLYFTAAGDVDQSGIDGQLLKHKICFRAGKRELAPLLGGGAAEKVSVLPDREYFYTDGITKTTFRPFLHPGLAWDGWHEDENGSAAVENNSDEYLL